MRHARVSFVLLVLVVLVTALSAGPAFAQRGAAPVRVVNTPLPVLVSNPVSSVVVTSLPAVVISGMPTVTVSGTVRVMGDDNPDQQEIYREDANFPIFAKDGEECLAPVPAGRRLVIEHVTARVFFPDGQEGYAGLKAGGHFVAFLPLTYHFTEVTGMRYFISSIPAKIRLEAGESPCFLIYRNPFAGQAGGLFTVSGYLIDDDTEH